MFQPWVIFWFFAVMIYIMGKTIKKKTMDLNIGNKYFVLSLALITNGIAVVLGAIATWFMLSTNYNL